MALAWLVVLGTASGAHAQSASSPPASNAHGATPAVQSSAIDAATVTPPPFWVAGVVITQAQRSAVLVVLDEARRDVGVITLRQAESYGGYRVATIESDRVLFEREGTVFPVVVGRPYAGPRGAPDSAPRTFFIPGPDKPTPDVPYTRPEGRPVPSDAPSGDAPDPEALGKFLGRVFNHPLVEQKLQEMRPAIQQSLERARQDGQGAPAAPAPNAPPAPLR